MKGVLYGDGGRIGESERVEMLLEGTETAGAEITITDGGNELEEVWVEGKGFMTVEMDGEEEDIEEQHVSEGILPMPQPPPGQTENGLFLPPTPPQVVDITETLRTTAHVGEAIQTNSMSLEEFSTTSSQPSGQYSQAQTALEKMEEKSKEEEERARLVAESMKMYRAQPSEPFVRSVVRSDSL